MTIGRCLLPALVLFNTMSLVAAQTTIRLDFEVYRNGVLVGNPEMSVRAGTAGRLEIAGVGRIAFTPTFRDADSVSIAFDINVSGRHLDPVMVIGRNDRGSANWSSTTGQDVFKLTVNWAP
ncbi:MAG: hypothetical protein DMF84_06320 [Acidobacteria bacterium]|nr:MAG: hypothetical protein DMF84_06320 [Acidobacteriota bacterium]